MAFDSNQSICRPSSVWLPRRIPALCSRAANYYWLRHWPLVNDHRNRLITWRRRSRRLASSHRHPSTSRHVQLETVSTWSDSVKNPISYLTVFWIQGLVEPITTFELVVLKKSTSIVLIGTKSRFKMIPNSPISKSFEKSN